MDVTCVLAPWNPTSSWSPGCVLYLQYVVQHSHVQQFSHMTMWPCEPSEILNVFYKTEICRYCLQTFLWREMQLHVRQSDLKHAKRKVVASWVSIWPETTRYCTYCRVPLASMVRSLDNPHLWIGPSQTWVEILSRSILCCQMFYVKCHKIQPWSGACWLRGPQIYLALHR